MDELNNREEIAEPEKMAQQSANITKKNRLILLDCWNKIDKKQDLPEDFFQSLPKEVEENLYEKIRIQSWQVLHKGYKSWPYKRYRVDILGKDGVETLFSEIIEYLLLTSEKDSFVNLKLVFRGGENQLNKNIRHIVRRVLAANRDRTVLDRLLRRIEDLVNDPTSEFVRSRTGVGGKKLDYYSIDGKEPELRDATREEVEKVISKIGHFEELPVKKDAKQASRVYTTEQLYEMFKIICTELDTDVSLTTLTMIFLDLIPDYLPEDFVAEQSLKVYGEYKVPVKNDIISAVDELEIGDQIAVTEITEQIVEELERLEILHKVKPFFNEDTGAKLSLTKLSKNKVFTDLKDVESVNEHIEKIVKRLFVELENDEIATLALSALVEKINSK